MKPSTSLAEAESLAAGLPKLLLAAEQLAFIAAAGLHGRRRAGAGDSFWQFRDWRNGDDIRRIDWRRSAMGEQLYLREREWEAQTTIALRLCDSPGMSFRAHKNLPSKRDRAILLLLALGCLLLRAGERVALYNVTPPLAGNAALPAIAQAISSGGQTPTDAKIRQAMFGDFLTPSPKIAAPPGGAVLQILDPAECDFPFTGRILFEDFGQEPEIEAARAEEWGETYRARIKAQREAVAKAAGQSGQTYLFHRTDSPPRHRPRGALSGAAKIMVFAAPLALLGLAALPALYFLLRLYPPQIKRIKFPPLALLRDLAPGPRTPRRIPIWLLLLRLFATALIILGMAGPTLNPPKALPGNGPILLVIDNGWASATDWPTRVATANRLLAAASAEHGIAILATAPGADGAAPHIQGLMTATQAGQVIAALQPEPWPVNRVEATAALQSVPASTTRLYIADGITDGPGFPAFLKALHPDRVFTSGVMPALLSPAALNADGSLQVQQLSGPAAGAILAQDAGGNTLARTNIDRRGQARIQLPLPLANKITALRLDGPGSAGAVSLLDDSSRAVIAGLAATGNNADTPFLGPLYFVRRGLAIGSQIITGPLGTLVADKVNLIILADTPLNPTQQDIAQSFISHGGVLIRFAGPLTASTPDALYPSPLLPGERRLGGALSWSTPLHLAAFPGDAPLAGLSLDPNATISRQILADPTRLDPATVWASLSDGTPLVLGKKIGDGYLISILTTANTDWSSLAISGLFPALMNRLTGLGRDTSPDPNRPLPLKFALTAYGVLSSAIGTASITPGGLSTTTASPDHPPGIYGDGTNNIAFNLGGHVPPPLAAVLPNAAALTGNTPVFNLGGPLLAAGLLLLIFDLATSLALRGLLKFALLLLLASIATVPPAKADDATLQTELGYIITNDAATDQLSADGLGYLSAYVSAHTSAQLGNPAGLNPATDDLNLYPLIYWPIRAGAPPLAPAACTALTSYMAHGGLLLIDTQGGDAGMPGTGAGFAPGAAAALAQATSCLNLPPLEPLTTTNILAHCFYIVRDFPGRFTGAPVMIATAPARDADDVTPVIIGANDWAGAWARDSSGEPEQTPIPGGEDQRVIADRFGTNLVIYALTGSYKADQASAPILLDKLGQ